VCTSISCQASRPPQPGTPAEGAQRSHPTRREHRRTQAPTLNSELSQAEAASSRGVYAGRVSASNTQCTGYGLSRGGGRPVRPRPANYDGRGVAFKALGITMKRTVVLNIPAGRRLL
jgi:hypothetical protein